MVTVSIIVSNRNGQEVLRPCLASLRGVGRPRCPHEVLVTDNASTDGSVEMVRALFPEVRVLAHARDLGFSGSNNRAIAESTGRYFLLLNNDTLVLPSAIDRLVDFLERSPEAAGVGARLIYPDGREQFSGRRFPSPVNALFGRLSLLSLWFPGNPWTRKYEVQDRLTSRDPFLVDWVSAAGAAFRREAVNAMGALDPDLYYWVEAEWCLRMQRGGWKVFLHPEAWIVHFEGMGSGPRPRGVQRAHHLSFARGGFRFYTRHRNLSRLDPRRLLAWCGLYGRAGLLMLRDLLGGSRDLPAMAAELLLETVTSIREPDLDWGSALRALRGSGDG